MGVCRKSPRTHFGTPVYAGGIHLDNSTPISSITAGPDGSVCVGTAPGVRYNETTAVWEFSNDGLDWFALGSGVGSGSCCQLGVPLDGTYNDGYIQTWTPTTFVRDAIDDLNEVIGDFSGSGFIPIKVTEYVTSQINENTNHTLPNAEMFKMASGAWMDVYLNGQLITHTSGSRGFDYEEVSTSQIKFHFDVPIGMVLSYTIRKRP